MPKRTRNHSVTDEAFVSAWQNGGDVNAIAANLGLGYFATTSRACRLRKAGVNLKKLFPLKGKRKIVDVKGLNKLIKELA